MKRAAPWENDAEDGSSDDSSGSDSSLEDDGPGIVTQRCSGNIAQKAKEDALNAISTVKKRGLVDFNALSRHGYGGGPSVLKVPEPRKEQDWSWSKGKREDEESKESYEERERTRAALSVGESLLNVQKIHPAANKKEKGVAFSQREKRKRDLGQASRGKSYVEEEKRLLRDSGVYSGFDS